MRNNTVKKSLENLLSKKIITRKSNILIIAGSDEDKNLLLSLGFNNITISNLDKRMDESSYAPYNYSHENAMNLSYNDCVFDFVFVSDGLHHCSSPHLALVEMYRVAKYGVIVVESRDNYLIRLAIRLNIVSEYEIDSVIENDFEFGGVDNSSIPNYIYRWVESEFEKTIKTYDPIGKQKFYYYYDLNLPEKLKHNKLIKIIQPIIVLLSRIFKKQCNSFTMVVVKPKVPKELFPWLIVKNGVIQFNKEFKNKLEFNNDC